MNNLPKSYPSIEEIISMPALSGITISEDGRNIAFVKRTANWKDNTYDNKIWIYEKDKGMCEPLAIDDRDCTHPLWSPDSKTIAYLRPAAVGILIKDQIFIRAMDSDQEVQITFEQEGVSKFQWEPAGKGFYYIAQGKESEEISGRKEQYGDFQYIGKEYRSHCLYFIDFQKATQIEKAIQLTDGKDFHIKEFDVSNDGQKIVCRTAPSPEAKDDRNGELYLLDVTAETLQKLNLTKIPGERVCFSPDGMRVCYTASIRDKDYYQDHIQDSTLEIVDLSTGESVQPLMDFDSTVSTVRWTAKGIFIRWQDKTNYLIGLMTDGGTVKRIGKETGGFVMEASITADGNHTAAIQASVNETFEIYLDSKKITDENRFLQAKIKSDREIITWLNSEGQSVEGVLSTPVDYNGAQEYPLLLVIHGGPAWASFPIHSSCFNDKYPIESFIESGFIVLEPNYRGSSGYGNDFLKAAYRNLGTGDYDDVISGVEQLIGKGIADRERVGVMGWSNGGYIAAFCSTYSNRFKAVSVGGGITNWTSHYANTDIPYSIRSYLGNTPWNDPEIYAKASPMTYIKSACTPTLIQHGEVDERVPVTNAYELHQGLKDMQVETEMVVFKGMAYSSEQPGIHAAIMKQNLEWFSRFVLGKNQKC